MEESTTNDKPPLNVHQRACGTAFKSRLVAYDDSVTASVDKPWWCTRPAGTHNWLLVSDKVLRTVARCICGNGAH